MNDRLSDLAKSFWHAAIWSRRLYFKPQDHAISALIYVEKNATGLLKTRASQRLKEISRERTK